MGTGGATLDSRLDPTPNPKPSPNPNPSQVGRPIQWGAFSSTAWDASTAKLFTDRDSGVIPKLT